MTRPPFITFYSFKGGVGRTQAVANVGAQLASRGFRVLLVDFDLEAPGLTWLDKSGHKTATTPGVVDLLLAAKRDGVSADLFTKDPAQILADYSHPVILPDALRSPEGSLRIMPAGRNDAKYGGALQALNLGELYVSGVGKPLIEHFKSVLKGTGELDFVLVDSRTGFSDESGICTRDLADGLVMVVGLNRQNREGSARFLTKLKASGPLPLAVAMSPVPNSEDEAVDAAEEGIIKLLTQAWGAEVEVDVRIPYQPKLALSEDLRFWSPKRPLGLAYQNLFAKVMAVAGHQPDALVQRVLDAAKKGDKGATLHALRMVGRLSPERVEGLAMSDDVRALLKRDGTAELHEALRNLLPGHSWVVHDIALELSDPEDERAVAWWEHGQKAVPKSPALLGNYANFLKNVRQDHDAAEDIYKRAIEAGPKHANNLGNYANFLTDVRQEHDAAEDLYQRAIEAGPKHAGHLGNYANFLTGVRQDHDAAEDIYKRAIEAGPKHAGHLGNYANFLTGVRQDHDAAEDIYKRAIEAGPKHADHLGNYALFLADVRQDHDAAENLYKRAIETDPNHPNNLANYAKLLLLQGRIDEARDLITRAWSHQPSSIGAVELLYYQWAFQLDDTAWPRLATLLSDGIRSPRWPLKACAEAAIAHGHPDPDLVRAVALVISEEADIDSLDSLPGWVEGSS